MKKHTSLLLLFMLVSLPVFAQSRYLVDLCEVLRSEQCTLHKGDVDSVKMVRMAGDEYGCGGFLLSGEGAYATFSLGGEYESFSFTIGHDARCTERVGAVTIYGDEGKLFDEKVRGYEPPRSYTVSVAGVQELTFRIAAEDIDVAVLDAMLWSAEEEVLPSEEGATPAEVAAELVKDIKPYFMSSFMAEVTPEEAPIMISGYEYEYGLRGNMTKAVADTDVGYAYFNLHRQYAKLSFVVGCHNDISGHGGSGWVTVKADDKIVEEIEIEQGSIARQVVLDIPNCEMLSFHTERIAGDLYAEIANIKVYPEGLEVDVAITEDGLAPANPRLKQLPDVCKLISNIKPYQAQGRVKKQIYDGSSDHVTFSMGGVDFSEGITLYQTPSISDGTPLACATFDMGNEFDYISFTVGYIGKSWSMSSDTLMVYADDELVFSTTLIPTCANQSYVVPINRCRMLRICNTGCGNLDVATFGVADIVAYRGECVENTLFMRPKPECPNEIDLIDLGKPYLHYVSTASDQRADIIRDGTTKRLYYEIGGERIYKGFVLQTNSNFTLDCGAQGADSVVTLAPMASFLMQATGGEAAENSLAAFNTYGEYNTVTFKVGSLSTALRKSDYHEHLMIGADQRVVASIGLYESMEPQEVTVPIDGCEQLMFWLSNTNGNSVKFVIYDIVVRKDSSMLDIPIPVRYSIPEHRTVMTTKFDISRDYIRYPNSNRSEAVDSFLSGANTFYKLVRDAADSYKANYVVYTYYLDSSSGPCKVIELRSAKNQDHNYNAVLEYNNVVKQVNDLSQMKTKKRELKRACRAAKFGLWSMGLDAFQYRKYIKVYELALEECFAVVDALYEEKRGELAFLERVMKKPLIVDDVESTEKSRICPIGRRDVLPEYPLQHITYFEMKK